MTIKLTPDGSNTLYSPHYQQTFHSDKGAVTESKHVFLQASGVAYLLSSQEVRVLEIGFGTGLNFFLTADLALQSKANLKYTALEKALLPSETIQGLEFDSHLQNPEVLRSFLEFRSGLSENPVGQYSFEYQSVSLKLCLGEATEQELEPNFFDAIYQDAFSPDANPELWTETFFRKLYNSLKHNGYLTTYSVKGDVRRTLQSLGFGVHKRPGPVGGKREMLVAKKLENGKI